LLWCFLCFFLCFLCFSLRSRCASSPCCIMAACASGKKKAGAENGVGHDEVRHAHGCISLRVGCKYSVHKHSYR
jgi:hypothetical protein